jgi:hypothetical protein
MWSLTLLLHSFDQPQYNLGVIISMIFFRLAYACSPQLLKLFTHIPIAIPFLECLQLPPHLLQSRFLALQNLLFIPTPQASSMILRQPQLLAYASETLQSRLVSLKNLLRISLAMALVVVARHPNLLCFRPSNLEASVHPLLPLPS